MLDFDFIEWDDDDDPAGNVQHIAANGLTPDEVEDVLDAPERTGTSHSSGRPVVFGTTSAGKHIIVIYDEDTAGGVTVVRPVTAYEVPEPD